ncbi:MAG: alanine racemase, partial [Alphaproteobacteria bacterium]|nr:alanine racemase [Alphaproteobacteria bacterium]
TGMNRLGLAMAEIAEVAGLSQKSGLRWWGLMSHLACDDHPLDSLAGRQKQRFETVLRAIPHARASLAASSGIGLGAEFHYDIVRPGIGLYGVLRPLIHDPASHQTIAQHLALRVMARVCQNRRVDAGESVGYGATEVMESGGRVAVVGLGYADFFPRHRGGGEAQVKVGGFQVRPIGRVSMDLLSLDVSAVPPDSCRVGDWVEVIGPDNPLTVLADDAETSPYELLTRLGDRATRHYIQP